MKGMERGEEDELLPQSGLEEGLLGVLGCTLGME